MRKLVAVTLALVLSLSFVPYYAPAAVAAGADLPSVSDFHGVSYASLGPVPAAHVPEGAIGIDLGAYTEAGGVAPLTGGEGGLLLPEDGFVTYTVDIPRDGRYCLYLDYLTLPGSHSNIELAVYIDGEIPFREAGVCLFRRTWRYAEAERRFDNKGNMLRPTSAEELALRSGSYFEDKEGLFIEPFAFFFSAGVHTVTLRSVREPSGLLALRLTPPPVIPAYAEVAASYPPGAAASAQPVTVPATDAYRRSDQALLPITDRSNPYLDPVSLTSISYNVIGGDTWCRPGQSISWLLDIPEDGLYSLNFVYKQDAVVSLPVTRSLRIDGEFPFAEARALTFPYSPSWERMAVSVNGEDALFWLEKGQHEVALSVTLGDTADICRRVLELTERLSFIYTQIVMITGPNPDPMRDYQIDARLPGIMGDFARIAAELDVVGEDIQAIGGGRNDALTISIIASQLHDFVAKPDSIPGRLMRFKDNIVNLSIWILMSSEMPLALYSVTACAPDAVFDSVKPGFWASLWFGVKRFFASFTTMADVAGNVYDDEEEHVITVWGRYGKDFAEMFKRLCDEVFTPEYGIKVNFQILTKDEAMFFSIAAKEGPDICLNVFRSFPLDFGLRDAAADLTGLPGYDAFEALFPPTATAPLGYDGKVYGFPVTNMFPVMYVRTDIMADLGLSIPQTWDDFYKVTKALAERNLQFSAGGDLMGLFLLQNGGRHFADDLKSCILDTPAGIAAMTEYTNLYTMHGAPVVADFFNRFRTGEMPIGIADIETVNILNYAALEIKDSWTVYPVPGVKKEDGTIDRTIVSSAGSAAGPLSTAGFITNSRPERLDDAWTFVRWFMSEETQARYSRECEAMFGVFARQFPATVAAHASIPWDRHTYDTIMASIANIDEIPGVPGAYFIGRHMDNAKNEIVIQGEMPRTAMIKYVEMINREIVWKRRELGLD